jgi:hypothetical protein
LCGDKVPRDVGFISGHVRDAHGMNLEQYAGKISHRVVVVLTKLSAETLDRFGVSDMLLSINESAAESSALGEEVSEEVPLVSLRRKDPNEADGSEDKNGANVNNVKQQSKLLVGPLPFEELPLGDEVSVAEFFRDDAKCDRLKEYLVKNADAFIAEGNLLKFVWASCLTEEYTVRVRWSGQDLPLPEIALDFVHFYYELVALLTEDEELTTWKQCDTESVLEHMEAMRLRSEEGNQGSLADMTESPIKMVNVPADTAESPPKRGNSSTNTTETPANVPANTMERSAKKVREVSAVAVSLVVDVLLLYVIFVVAVTVDAAATVTVAVQTAAACKLL